MKIRHCQFHSTVDLGAPVVRILRQKTFDREGTKGTQNASRPSSNPLYAVVNQNGARFQQGRERHRGFNKRKEKNICAEKPNKIRFFSQKGS